MKYFRQFKDESDIEEIDKKTYESKAKTSVCNYENGMSFETAFARYWTE